MFLRSLQLVLIGSLLPVTALAATDPFTGSWKLNPSKSKLTDQMKVEAAGPNTYTLIFSGDNKETVVADGTDQPGLYGTTFSITVVSPHQWKGTRKKDGRLLISATWTLSDDSNTLTDDFTGYRADGTTSNLLYKYTRTTPGTGFVATWESVTEQVNSTYEMQVETYQDSGLSFINPSQKMTRSLNFDGKDYPGQGPNLPAGYASSAHRISDRTLELTDKINDKIMDTQEVEVSPDGKVLTMTTHIPGQAKPNIQVFDRQ